jgi:P27 family predicted phage terminase small subunit
MTNEIMKAPSSLNKPGRKFWKTIVNDYILDVDKQALLEQACRCLDEISEHEQAIEKDGRYFTDRYSQVKEHPASAALRQTRALFQRLVREIGFDIDNSDSRPPRYGG